eukprot:symbB.v1.2.028230.t1/scaffold2973.1/size66149/2
MQCLLPSGLSSDPNDTADLDPTTASSEPGDPEPTEPWKERVKRRLRECCRSSAEQCRQLWRRLRGHMACLGEKLLKRIQESPVGQRLPSRVQVLGFVHRRITETLILTVFIFVNFFAMNFMTILQQLLCLWMLVLPKRISVLLTDRLLMAAACLSLVAQILGFAGWHGFSEEQALYFGVAPRLSDADWVTQRQRCGSDVVYWLCLDSGLRVPKFVLFFTLCWVLHSREISVSVQQTPETREGGTPRWVHWTLDGISNYIYEGNRTASWDSCTKGIGFETLPDLSLYHSLLDLCDCCISISAALQHGGIGVFVDGDGDQ